MAVRKFEDDLRRRGGPIIDQSRPIYVGIHNGHLRLLPKRIIDLGRAHT